MYYNHKRYIFRNKLQEKIKKWRVFIVINTRHLQLLVFLSNKLILA